jgi:molybdate transport system substrate-binding protein
MISLRNLVPVAFLAALIFAGGSVRSEPAQSAPSAQSTLTVFAASSLIDAFREIGVMFETNTGTPVSFNFGASTQLRTQLEQGAPADVFASADAVQMDRARQAGVIAGQDQVFANNRLVVITPASNPAAITGPGDLDTPGLKIVTAQQDVPIGVYTQTMFEKMSGEAAFGADFKDRANANIVSHEPNVRQIVAKIQLGEGDAAIVYRSDVTPGAAPDLATLDISDRFNIIAQYPIAMVAGSRMNDAATQFIALVMSPEGQGVLQRWNFLPGAPAALKPAAR